jgi:pSer/pThr/pTyr-binding forkhead associated (FHA) protein
MKECPLCGASFPAGISRCPECCIDFSSVIAPAPTLMGQAIEETEAAAAALPVPAMAVPVAPAASVGQPPDALPVAIPLVELPNPTPAIPLPAPASVPEQDRSDTLRFRPVRRPPMALLSVLDDGREDGEWVRLRTPRFVIGRTEGDLVIAHDSMMSSRHAEITRQLEKDRYRWYLTDLESTNGSYLKIASVVLKHGQEVLIGSHRLRFNAAPPGAVVSPGDSATQTQGWQPVAPDVLVPSLIEITTQGEGQRYFLHNLDNWIGRDGGQCSVVLANDPLVDLRHARLHRDPKGRWRLDNNKSRNGTWLRIDKVLLDGTSHFLLGEQRFLVKFP